MSNIEKILEEEIISLNNLVFLFSEAARTERFLSRPKPPNTPAMYDLLSTLYEPGDWSYYEKALMKIRATPKQITRWEFCIDALLAIEEDISKDPLLDRQIVGCEPIVLSGLKLVNILVLQGIQSEIDI